jgi:hypothetical protein
LIIKQYAIPAGLNRGILIQVYNDHRTFGLPISFAKIGSVDALRGAGIVANTVGDNTVITTYDQIYPCQIDERVPIGKYEVTFGATNGYQIMAGSYAGPPVEGT